MEIIFCGTWGRVMCRGKIYMTKRMLMSGGSMPKKWSFLKTRKGLVWLKPSSRKPDMVSDKRGRIFFNRKLLHYWWDFKGYLIKFINNPFFISKFC